MNKKIKSAVKFARADERLLMSLAVGAINVDSATLRIQGDLV